MLNYFYRILLTLILRINKKEIDTPKYPMGFLMDFILKD